MKAIRPLPYNTAEVDSEIRIFGKLAFITGEASLKMHSEGYTTRHHNEPDDSELSVQLHSLYIGEQEVKDKDVLERIVNKLW